MDKILEVKNLKVNLHSKKRPVFTPVHCMNFSISKGETVALVGESGSGKSMTALAIMGLLKSWNSFINAEILGEINFFGENGVKHKLHTYDDRYYDKVRGDGLSIIFQNPLQSLNPVVNIGDQMCKIIMAHSNVGKTEALKKSIELLREVGIDNPQDRIKGFPHQFSGGQLQRIIIAMAISGNTRCLIADEPTTALDVTIQKDILDLLKRLQKSRGMGILLITHDLGVVSEFSDKVLVMNEGRLLEKGSVKEIFESPKHPYTKLLIESIPDINSIPQTLLKTKRDFINPNNFAKGSLIFDNSQIDDMTENRVSDTHIFWNTFTRVV